MNIDGAKGTPERVESLESLLGPTELENISNDKPKATADTTIALIGQTIFNKSPNENEKSMSIFNLRNRFQKVKSGTREEASLGKLLSTLLSNVKEVKTSDELRDIRKGINKLINDVGQTEGKKNYLQPLEKAKTEIIKQSTKIANLERAQRESKVSMSTVNGSSVDRGADFVRGVIAETGRSSLVQTIEVKGLKFEIRNQTDRDIRNSSCLEVNGEHYVKGGENEETEQFFTRVITSMLEKGFTQDEINDVFGFCVQTPFATSLMHYFEQTQRINSEDRSKEHENIHKTLFHVSKDDDGIVSIKGTHYFQSVAMNDPETAVSYGTVDLNVKNLMNLDEGKVTENWTEKLVS